MGIGKRWFLGLGFLVLAGCARETGILYHVHDVPFQGYEAVHSLKQLQGQRKVDILWVVDNSGSMSTHQANLIKNVDLFINQFVAKGGLEWKMGVISTDIRQPPFAGFTPTSAINYAQPDGVARFQAAIRRLGTSGDSVERMFAPIQKHLTDFPDFLRPEATLAIIIISDAAEQSSIRGSDMLSFIHAKKSGDHKKAIFYGALTPTDFVCPPTGEDRWAYAGSVFEEVIDGTKGKLYKLCGDFGQNLADLGRDLITRVERPYIALKDRPNPSSIRVVYKGKDLSGGMPEDGGYWIYDFDLNRVVFHNLAFAPGDTEEVTISYAQ
jgi:hypothetical protein